MKASTPYKNVIFACIVWSAVSHHPPSPPLRLLAVLRSFIFIISSALMFTLPHFLHLMQYCCAEMLASKWFTCRKLFPCYFFFVSIFIVWLQSLAKLNDRHPITSDLLRTIFLSCANISATEHGPYYFIFLAFHSTLSPHLSRISISHSCVRACYLYSIKMLRIVKSCVMALKLSFILDISPLTTERFCCKNFKSTKHNLFKALHYQIACTFGATTNNSNRKKRQNYVYYRMIHCIEWCRVANYLLVSNF